MSLTQEEKNAKRRAKYALNKDKHNEKRREHYVKNREKIRATNNAWKRNNREKANAIARRHYHKYHDREVEKKREYRANNLERRREIERKYTRTHKEQRRTYRKEYGQTHRRELYMHCLEYKNKDPEKWLKYGKDWTKGKRYKIIEHYSKGKFECACCGETMYEFLSIDHINNDGAEHRKKIGTNIMGWLIKNNFPEGFQILCMNCNYGKRFTGICPHKVHS